jgi:hypothetical protein
VLEIPKDPAHGILFDGLLEAPSATVLPDCNPEIIPEVHVVYGGVLEVIPVIKIGSTPARSVQFGLRFLVSSSLSWVRAGPFDAGPKRGMLELSLGRMAYGAPPVYLS